MKKIIIFIGPLGSGKGTQAKKLAAKHGYIHISTGDLLRRLEVKKNPTLEEVDAIENMRHGKLVADKTVYRMAFAEIEKSLVVGKGVVLDGAVRTVAQAEHYERFFEEHGWSQEVVVVEIAVPDEVTFKRLASRRICSRCGEIVSIAPHQTEASCPLCPKCSGRLVIRPDDSVEIITKRIVAQGNRALEPIRAFYQARALWIGIDGVRNISVVEADIEKKLNTPTPVVAK